MDFLQYLIDGHPALGKFAIHVIATGAGAGLQKLLWDKPGASAFLSGASFPYAQAETVRLLGYKPESFVSERTACDLAIAAYLQIPEDSNPVRVGVGITSAVSTNRVRRGRNVAYIAIIAGTITHTAWLGEVVLDQDTRTSQGQWVDYVAQQALAAATEFATAEDVRYDTHILWKDNAGLWVHDALYTLPVFSANGQRREMPWNKALYPGAFNPVHVGHLEVAGPDVTYQITTASPHKPPLELTETLDRIRQIRNSNREVLITQGLGLYIEKARAFPGYSLIMGVDALERMLDPKWGPSIAPMLDEFRQLGTKFTIAGRQGKTLADVAIPTGYEDLFTGKDTMPHHFVSSTAIREGLMSPSGVPRLPQ